MGTRIPVPPERKKKLCLVRAQRASRPKNIISKKETKSWLVDIINKNFNHVNDASAFDLVPRDID